jgi:hypothetical protein
MRPARFGSRSRAKEAGRARSFPLRFAARVVSRGIEGGGARRGRRSERKGPGERSRPYPAEPPAAGPEQAKPTCWLWGVESNHQPSG